MPGVCVCVCVCVCVYLANLSDQKKILCILEVRLFPDQIIPVSVECICDNRYCE